MSPNDIIKAYRNSPSEAELLSLRQYLSFKPTGALDDTGGDENLEFRTEVTNTLLEDFSLADIQLIRDLFEAELCCEKVIWRHDNLYQLSYYLYSLGQHEDTFLLYKAKYDYSIVHMDASTMQDQYFLTVGHEPEVIINYVEARFKENPNLQSKYPKLLEELYHIRDEREYGTISDYTNFIRGYFNGQQIKSLEENMQLPNHSIQPKKPWWKFW